MTTTQRYGATELAQCEALESRRLMAAAAGVTVNGDFNGDGLVDLVTTRGGLKLRLNEGNGVFGAPIPIGGTQFARGGSVAAADFNKDGALDVVVFGGKTKSGPKQLRTGGLFEFLNNGDGTFQAAIPVSGGTVNGKQVPGGRVMTGDFNLDGNPDILVARAGANGTPTSFNGAGAATGIPTTGATPGGGFFGTTNLSGPTSGNSLGTGTTDLLGGMNGGGFIGTTGTFGVGEPTAGTGPSQGSAVVGPPEARSTAFVIDGNGNGTFNAARRITL